MSDIVQNIGCPECMKRGHDNTQNHLIVFADGNKLCSRKHFHATGRVYFESAGDGQSITDMPIKGDIKYTVKQFKELQSEGKLSTPVLRELALSGMRNADRWEVMTDEEKQLQQAEWDLDVEFLEDLKAANLPPRHLKGEFVAFYGVKVGRLAPEEGKRLGKVNRHYYPRYEDDKLVGAKCRTVLDEDGKECKEFRFGHLGKLFGKQDLFGMNTLSAVVDSGERMHTLMIVGGELDAISSQQILCEANTGQYEGRHRHIWSVNKGESGVEEILANRDDINKFKRIIWAFDNDEAGNKLNKECARLFRGKSFFFKYPAGCKDANKCLTAGKSKEFVDAWFNPQDITALSPNIKSMRSMSSELKKGAPEAGLAWPWSSLNKITLGIRKHCLFVIGAGSGVGKTEFCREVVKHLIEEHGESVGIISTEDPTVKVGRAYAGKWMDKRIELPKTNDKKHEDYREIFDYTDEEADACIDYVADTGKLFIADLEGDYSLERIIQTCEDFEAMGIQNIFIDNLTGISVPHGKNKVEFLDEAVKTIGNLKDRKPMTIFLVSHLKRVGGNGRTPHEEGGEVILEDFRGSGAIGFWASYAIGIERNTRAEDLTERCTTHISCVKDRDQGIFTGEKVAVRGNVKTGKLTEPRKGFMSTSIPDDDEVPEGEYTEVEEY